MVWSKVVIYFINAIGTSIVFSILVHFSLDLKYSVFIYGGTILILMYFADKLSELDKTTALSKERDKNKKLQLKIDSYDDQIASIHNLATQCLTGGMKSSSIKYQIQSILQRLHQIKCTTERQVNSYDEKQKTTNIKTDTGVDFN